MLVRNDKIDAAAPEHGVRGPHDHGCVRRSGEAVHERPYPKVAEELVVPHLGIEQERPPDDPSVALDQDADESVVLLGIEQVQCRGVAIGHERYDAACAENSASAESSKRGISRV